MTSKNDDLKNLTDEELVEKMEKLSAALGLPKNEEEAEFQLCLRFEDDMEDETTANLFRRYESDDLSEFEFRENVKSFHPKHSDKQIFKSMKLMYPNTAPHHLYVLIQRCLNEA